MEMKDVPGDEATHGVNILQTMKHLLHMYNMYDSDREPQITNTTKLLHKDFPIEKYVKV